MKTLQDIRRFVFLVAASLACGAATAETFDYMDGGNPYFPIPERNYENVDGVRYGYIVDSGRAMLFSWEYNSYMGRAFPCNAVSAKISENGSYYPFFVKGDIVVPSTLGGLPVTKIGRKAFQGCTQITSVEVPEGVVDIEDKAFATNSLMRTFICAESVTNISCTAFQACTSLVSIVLKGDTKIQYSRMSGPMNLRELSIPVMKVADYFYANNVTNLTFNDKGQKSINASLFGKSTDTLYSWNCSKVERLTLLGDFDSVAANTFSGTLPNLKEVRVAQSSREKVVAALASAGRDVSVVLIDDEGNVVPELEIVELSVKTGSWGIGMIVTVVQTNCGTASTVDPAKVAAMFEATSDLRDWNGAAKLTPEVEVLGTDANGKMTFAVTPGDGTAQSAFLRIMK